MSEVEKEAEAEPSIDTQEDEDILQAASIDNNSNLDVILNIPVQVSLELGRTKNGFA